MKKVLMFICLLLLALPFVAMGQGTTMSLGSVTAPAVGAAVSVPITVTNFTNIGSITLKIAYNPAVITFTGVANAPSGVTFSSNAANGVVTLIWYDASGTTPLNIPSGKLVDLNFTYVSGSGAITFNQAQCELTTGSGAVISTITYNNGTIGTNTATTVKLGSVSAPSGGGPVSIPITVTNFTNVGSITLKVVYNPAVVTFTGVANAPSGVTFSSNAANGVVTLIWYDASGTTPLSIASGKLVDLNFTYISGSSSFTFTEAQCEVTTSTGVAIGGIQYTNGNISSGSATTINLGAVTAVANTVVSVPITVTNLSSVGSITLKVQYDATVATFLNATTQLAGVTFAGNASNGVITLIWYDATGSSPLTVVAGKLLDLNFTYLGGSGNFTFNTAGCELSSGTGVILANVVYSSGSLGQVSKPVMNPIGAISKNTLDTVSFVVSATDPNGLTLTYTATGLPTGASFTPATKTFLWVPTLAQSGTFTPKFVVSNGSLTDSAYASITITKAALVVKNPIVDLDLNDSPIANRTRKIKLTSPPVFANNIGTLTYVVHSGNVMYVAATIIAPDTLKLQGLVTTPAGVKIRITLSGTDTDTRTIQTTFNVTVSGPTGVVVVEKVPTEFSLSQNYPNPFNPTTLIEFGLPSQAPVTMEIYNMLGVKVRTLLQGKVMSAGIHQMEWNGKDDAGISVTSGVYLYRINASGFQVTRKMMMLK